MKKISILLLMVFGYFSNAVAVEGFNLGVSLTAGVFEADGAKEEFKGAHAGGASPGNVSKSTATDGDSAKGLFGIGSIFAEVELTDVIAVGLDYVPMAMETETATNTQDDITTSTTSAARTNNVQIDFEDLTTLYVTLTPPDANGLYLKAGIMQVDVVTNEKLGTGGAYGNTDLDGYTIALGYNRDLANDVFVRLETSYMELDGTTLVNTADATKSVTAEGIDGYGARISVGKSF